MTRSFVSPCPPLAEKRDAGGRTRVVAVPLDWIAPSRKARSTNSRVSSARRLHCSSTSPVADTRSTNASMRSFLLRSEGDATTWRIRSGARSAPLALSKATNSCFVLSAMPTTKVGPFDSILVTNLSTLGEHDQVAPTTHSEPRARRVDRLDLSGIGARDFPHDPNLPAWDNGCFMSCQSTTFRHTEHYSTIRQGARSEHAARASCIEGSLRQCSIAFDARFHNGDADPGHCCGQTDRRDQILTGSGSAASMRPLKIQNGCWRNHRRKVKNPGELLFSAYWMKANAAS